MILPNKLHMGKFGESIDEYNVFEELGRGGFATVYRAKCRKSGMEVAIKKMDVKRIQEKGLIDRVREEVNIHSRLEHPSILELYTFFEDKRFIYLVLEFCHNGELQKYVKKRVKLTEFESCTIMTQVVEGMLYLHKHGIMHRDITLANILLTKDMRVKIADFGLATQLKSSNQQHMTMCGTPSSIAPEIATGDPYGKEADLWQLGIMLYTCLVGKPPLDTDGNLQYIFHNIAFMNIQFPFYVSSEAQDLIKALLRKNPQDRIKLTEILQQPFFSKFQSTLPYSSCDSGVATASSYSQPSTSHPHSSCPSLGKCGSFHNCRPPSPTAGRIFPSCTAENSACNLGISQMNLSDRYARSNHICPVQESQEHHFRRIEHAPIIPNRCLPYPQLPISNPQYQNHSSSSILKQSSGTYGENNCSHSWKQCQQCSHHEACGCIRGQQSYCSTIPKFTDNPVVIQPALSDNINRRSKCEKNNEVVDTPSKIRVSPLSTKRLRPIRQKAKTVVCSILVDGNVCLEFIKEKQGRERVCEIMKISSDGMSIAMYQPKKGKGVSLSESPPSLSSPSSVCSYENIPEKLWKKYAYAYKFIDLVKSRTRKITYYSKYSKCYLMETGDFEAVFYQGGKISKSQAKVNVAESSGKSWTFDYFDGLSTSSTELQLMWEHFKECFDCCIVINNAIEQAEELTKKSIFPMITGNRPQNSPLSSNKENMSPQSVVNIPTMRGYEPSIASTRQGVSTKSKGSKPMKQKTIPGIGNVSLLTNGEIHIHYLDSTRMVVGSTSAYAIFTDKHGKTMEYNKQNDNIPQIVKAKLGQMDMILKDLYSC